MRVTLKRHLKNSDLPPETLHAIQKWNAALLSICAFGAYVCSVRGYVNSAAVGAGQATFAVQNWGGVFLLFEIAFAYSLYKLQDGAYWLSWPRFRKTTLTDRQKMVRQHVFERAYLIGILGVFLCAPSVFSTFMQYAEPVRIDLMNRVAAIIGVLLVSLPAILAAWQKDR